MDGLVHELQKLSIHDGKQLQQFTFISCDEIVPSNSLLEPNEEEDDDDEMPSSCRNEGPGLLSHVENKQKVKLTTEELLRTSKAFKNREYWHVDENGVITTEEFAPGATEDGGFRYGVFILKLFFVLAVVHVTLLLVN